MSHDRIITACSKSQGAFPGHRKEQETFPHLHSHLSPFTLQGESAIGNPAKLVKTPLSGQTWAPHASLSSPVRWG